MEKTTFDVPGLCGPSTVVSVESLLSNIRGVAAVDADPLARTVTVEYDPDLVREDNLINEIAKLKVCAPDL